VKNRKLTFPQFPVTLHNLCIFVEITMVPHSFIVFFPNQLCTLGFYITFNVVKLMFIAFF